MLNDYSQLSYKGMLMAKKKKADFNITKIEKGPLQRFKNQNLLLRKFGETGLTIYRSITGKRTKEELKKDLGMDEEIFDSVIDFMKEAGIIELAPAGKKEKKPEKEAEEELGIEIPEETPSLEELPEEFPEEEIEKPLEEKSLKKKKKTSKKKPKKKKKKIEELEEELGIGEEDFGGEELPFEEEIKPLEEELPPIEEEAEIPEEPAEIEKKKDKPKPKKKKLKKPEELPEKDEFPEEETEPGREYEEIEPYEGEYSYSEEEEEVEGEEEYGGEELSEAEKKIKRKYGDVGLKVYALIDGERSAEEIMSETGLTESKLIEMLDFMDSEGIIKLDYPKEEKEEKKAPWSAPAEAEEETEISEGPVEKEGGFAPMLGEREDFKGVVVSSPVEIPVKAPGNPIKSVHVKAKTMLKFGEKGRKVLDKIDGKKDVIDISLHADVPLYETMDIISFLMENEMVLMKAVSRSDVRKKYGEDGYAVYKKFGREGLMLYELIGKDMTLKQMADKVTRNKTKVVDMFVFIYKVLNIELPLNEELLRKQLGL